MFIRVCAVVVFLFTLPAVALATAWEQPMVAPTLDTAAIDRFLDEQMRVQRVPGLALAVTQGDQIAYVKGYGYAHTGAPVTAETQFLIASLTKSFTALAVMQRVEAGQIALDAPVQRYLPDFTLADPVVAAQITVRQLLNQVSGLADAGFPEMRLPTPATLADRIVQLRRARPTTAPGTTYRYFNPNYQILARLVEVVSGEPFSTYLQRQIFAPLQMNHTVNLLSSADLAVLPTNLAQGHLLAFGLPLATGEETGFLGGSGGVVSTAEDLAHYLLLQSKAGRYQGAQLLSPAGMALLHTPWRQIKSCQHPGNGFDCGHHVKSPWAGGGQQQMQVSPILNTTVSSRPFMPRWCSCRRRDKALCCSITCTVWLKMPLAHRPSKPG